MQGARRITAQGTIPGEGFNDVDAALFRRGRERTLFIHNVWKAAATVDVSALVGPGGQAQADAVETPNLLASLQGAVPAPRPLAMAGSIAVPAHSLARIRWRA